MKKLLTKIKIILFIMLSVLLIYIFIQQPTNKASVSANNEVLAEAKLNDVETQYKLLKDETTKQNKMVSLEGDRQVEYTYHISDYDLKGERGNLIGFLANKLNEMGSKTLKIQTSFHYTYTYDLSDLDIIVQNNKLYITLYDYNIELQPLAEDGSKRTITTEKGLLSKKFTPQQIAALIEMTGIHTRNNIINSNDIIDNVLENTKENLLTLTKKLGINCTVIIAPYTPLIENNGVTVLSDSNFN